MSISSIRQLFQKAQRGKYALGAFNVFNLETAQAALEAGIKKRSPLIIQVTEKTIEYLGFKSVYQAMQSLIKKAKIPVILHLDHGKNLSIVLECIKQGFDSVMIDGSHLDFNKNISLTRKAVELAHRHRVWIEGELGAIPGKEGKIEGKEKDITDPDKAREFIKKTNIDALAVSIGSMHGCFKDKEKLDLKRLKAIREKTNKTVLVLHGASGLSKKDIKQAIKIGISKINIDTDLQLAFCQTLRKTLEQCPKIHDPRDLFSPSLKTFQKEVEKKIDLFNSRNKQVCFCSKNKTY